MSELTKVAMHESGGTKGLAERIQGLGFRIVPTTEAADIVVGMVCGCCPNFPDLMRSWYPGKKVVILRHGYNEIKFGWTDQHNTEYPRQDCDKDVLLTALNT